MEENRDNKLKEAEQTSEIEAVENDIPESEVDTKHADGKSGKLPPNVEELKGRAWLPYIITFAVLAVITLLVAWAQGGYTETDTKVLLGAWCDAFFVPGVLGVGFGLLVLASNGGAFDMLAYATRRFFALFKKDPIDRKYRTFYEYSQARKEKKRSFWYMVIVGGGYTLVAIILFVVYFSM